MFSQIGNVGGLLEGLLVVYKSRSLCGGYQTSGYRSAHPELAGSAVTISWNNGRSKKSRTSSSLLLTNPSFVRMNALVADPLGLDEQHIILIKQFEHQCIFLMPLR